MRYTPPSSTGSSSSTAARPAATWEKIGSSYFVYSAAGTLISSGVDVGDTVSDGIDYVFGLGGGDLQIKGNGLTATLAAGHPIVGKSYVRVIGEHVSSDPDGAVPLGGVEFRGPSASMTGNLALVEALDTKCFKLENIGLNAASQANFCFLSAGWRNEARNCVLTKSTTEHIRVTNVASATHDAYVDFRAGGNYIHGNGSATAYGIRCLASGAGSLRASDGWIGDDNRIFGCLAWAAKVELGGWRVVDNHMNGTSSSTGGLYMAGGMALGNTIDSIGNGNFLEIAGLGVHACNNEFLPAGSGSGHSIIHVTSGRDLHINDNSLRTASGQTYTYFLEWDATPLDRNSVVIGNIGQEQAPATAWSNYDLELPGYTYIGNGYLA